LNLEPEEKRLLRKAKLIELNRVMRSAGHEIAIRTNQAINGTLDQRISQGYWSAKLNDVKKVYRVIQNQFDGWMKRELPDYYADAYRLGEQIMRRGGLGKVTDVKYKGRILDSLLNDTITKMAAAIDGGLGRINTLFREVQTSSITEQQINSAIGEGLVTDATPQRVRSNLEKELRKSIIGEEKILAGTKNYTAESYSQMLARTRTRDAQSSATIQLSLDYGVDLVQVSDHNTKTPICIPYEGQIYSITGKSKTYPRLEESAPFHPNCLGKDTDILTKDGWVNVRKIKPGQEIFSLNMQSQNLELAKAISTVKVKADNMIEMSTRDFHMLVTDDHNMVYESDHSASNKQDIFKFIQAKELYNKKSGRFPRSVNRQDIDIPRHKIALAQLIVFIIADGHIDHKLKRITVEQDPIKSSEGYILLKNLFDETGFKYSQMGGKFVCYPLYQYLKEQGTANAKFIPQWIKDLPANALDDILHIYAITDGHTKKGKLFKGHQFKESRSFFTTSDKLASDIGEMILKTGKRPSYSLKKNAGNIAIGKTKTIKSNYDLWVISECSNRYATLQNIKWQKIKYDDYAYCVELNKNNTIYVRSNGKCAWTGNCLHVILPLPIADAEDEARIRNEANEIYIRNQYKLAGVEL
jgi:hypothetical protein